MSATGWLPGPVRTGAAERKLGAGQTLFRMGQRPAGLYEIVSGRVRMVRLDANGREIVLFTATAGDTLAEASLFSLAYHCDAIAATEAVVRLYPKAAVLDAIQRDPKVAQAFMAMMAREIMALRTRLEQAIKRMVPAHAHELNGLGWKATTEDLPDGVKLVVTGADARQAAKLNALGFMGIMVLGAHHQVHHMMMARGEIGVH